MVLLGLFFICLYIAKTAVQKPILPIIHTKIKKEYVGSHHYSIEESKFIRNVAKYVLLLKKVIISQAIVLVN